MGCNRSKAVKAMEPLPLMQHREASGTILAGAPAGVLKSAAVLEERIEQFGKPKADLCPPGECVFTEEWSSATLEERVQPTHDTFVLTFGLPDRHKPLGLSTCACILAKFDSESGSGAVVRPYTPVSTNSMMGQFEILIKVYDKGEMTQHLKHLPIGATMDFKHIPANVKVQYPFGKKHVTMLAGGVGITPCLQALYAILGTAGDTTQVSVIYCNKTEEDILCKDLLDTWISIYPDRLQVVHVVSRAGDDDPWLGTRGHIDRQVIEKRSASPSEDVLIMVCGPPGMYSSLCGPRESSELTGLLHEMGYTANQVVKF